MSSARVRFKFKIVKMIDHNPTIRELQFQLVDPPEAQFKFRAGQFVMLHVPQNPKPALRAYSIASNENELNQFRLILKHVEKGAASEYVWALKGDEILEFTGPFGRVFFQEPPKEQIFMISTSSGLAPHISYLESFVTKYPQVHFEILVGVRTEKDIFCENMLMDFQKKYSNFKFNFVLSRPSDRWTGKKGYVQDHLETLNYRPASSTFYLCGNENMTHAVRHKLIETDFDPCAIFVENF